ncbi:O-Antigen ligase, partial [Durusdinium trenchii]
VKAPEVAAAKDWNHYLRISFDLQKPSSRDPETEAFHREQRTLAVLRAVEKNPNDHRVQLRAAIAHLRLFSKYQLESGSGMSLMQIRDAVRASQFPPHEAMNEWLNKPGVLGESRQHLIDAATHLRMSLQLCPAQSRSYLELADLLWLEGIDDANELHLVEQAAILRPHDARVRFILGRDAWLSGRYEEALEHWQESFRQDSTYRDTLITSLSRFVPATFFLENFDVDRAALTKLREAYKESEDRAAYTKILKKLARACVVDAIQKEGMSAVRDWITASDRFLEAGETMYSFRCAQESHRLNPSSYDARWRLGHLYLKQEKFDLAAEHLLWCFQQKPDDPTTKRWAERAIALAQQKSSSAVTPVHALDTTRR